MSTRYKETCFGFEFGAAEVTRCTSDEKKGWVVVQASPIEDGALQITTPKEKLQIYVTKTGKIRVHDKQGKELK